MTHHAMTLSVTLTTVNAGGCTCDLVTRCHRLPHERHMDVYFNHKWFYSFVVHALVDDK